MKKLFEQSMWNMLEKNSIKNITLNMLVEDVGSCKGTFYKYYLDKFDLCNSCIKNKIYNQLERHDAYEEYARDCLEAFRSNANVIRHAFDSTDVNSARLFHETRLIDLLVQILAERNFDVSEPVCKLCLQMYAHSCTQVSADWLDNGCKEPIADILARVRAVTPQYLYASIYPES